MHVVTRRRKLSVLELLNGGVLAEDFGRITQQSHFPTHVVRSVPKKEVVEKTVRSRTKRQGKEHDEFMSKVPDTLPMPNTRRCLYREGKLTYVIAPA